MKERPILFSGPMVRAILDGTKTQTRRVVGSSSKDDWNSCPYGVVGDRLWVRERHALENRYRNVWCRYAADDARVAVPAPMLVNVAKPGWRSPIYMPRWASRITLEITDVRVQRVQEISGEDAAAEGVQFRRIDHGVPKHGDIWAQNIVGFQHLWDSINAKRAPWASNPWVWALRFRVVK